MDLAFLDKEANLRKASEMVREAAANGASLICLPEAFNRDRRNLFQIPPGGG